MQLAKLSPSWEPSECHKNKIWFWTTALKLFFPFFLIQQTQVNQPMPWRTGWIKPDFLRILVPHPTDPTLTTTVSRCIPVIAFPTFCHAAGSSPHSGTCLPFSALPRPCPDPAAGRTRSRPGGPPGPAASRSGRQPSSAWPLLHGDTDRLFSPLLKNWFAQFFFKSLRFLPSYHVWLMLPIHLES